MTNIIINNLADAYVPHPTTTYPLSFCEISKNTISGEVAFVLSLSVHFEYPH